MSTQAAINGKEIFELLRGDLSAIEREFGRDTVSGVEAITEIGDLARADKSRAAALEPSTSVATETRAAAAAQ